MLQRKACKGKNLQRKASKTCSEECAENSGTIVYLNKSSDLKSIVNHRATWASNQASKDVSSGLGRHLDFLQDQERQCCRPSVLWGSLGLSSLLPEVAVVQLGVWASTALNIRGVCGLLLLGCDLRAWRWQRTSVVSLASSLRLAPRSQLSP